MGVVISNGRRFLHVRVLLVQWVLYTESEGSVQSVYLHFYSYVSIRASRTYPRGAETPISRSCAEDLL